MEFITDRPRFTLYGHASSLQFWGYTGEGLPAP